MGFIHASTRMTYVRMPVHLAALDEAVTPTNSVNCQMTSQHSLKLEHTNQCNVQRAWTHAPHGYIANTNGGHCTGNIKILLLLLLSVNIKCHSRC